MQDQYRPQDIETQLYQKWEKSGYFSAKNNDGQAYSIVLPPPNVTGSLHMGHGFQDTLMDLLTRYHRMCGDKTLWQPGLDHAGIATQMMVEKQLRDEGTSRQAIGRDAFVERVFQWKEASGGQILQQMRRLGSSPDWSRERFTMDDGLSDAVRDVFVQLYDEGLIYRGTRLVNWDPNLKTAVSDLEVLSVEKKGSLWHIAYPLENGEKLTVATTRPETLLGDTAIAVNPDDERYAHLVGQNALVPLCDRKIPIIADNYVDKDFGTGCVKITPAHDFNDYEVGKRHDLPMINIMHKDGTLNENVPDTYQGVERFAARKQVLADLEAQGLLLKTEDHDLKLPIAERGGAVIEPRLSEQWYVKIAPLAEPALKAVKDGDIKFIPENAANTYYRWMEDIQDWCISRQLWWGHRIPAWYDAEGKIYVGKDEVEVRAKHNLTDDMVLHQDQDVLDTWFSSALWPFSTMGWPEKTPELQQFYPTSTLVTGFDIIFFWVARMIMFGIKFAGDVPFKEVYIHGLIRDSHGHKMSKTKGNVIDPVDLIDGIELDKLIEKRSASVIQDRLKEKVAKSTTKEFPEGIKAYGTDALRFTYTALASTSRDIIFDMGRMEGYRNFCNKLWNAARFVFMNVEDQDCGLTSNKELSIADHWIFTRLNICIEQCHKHIAEYRFDLLATCLYEFVWNDYCDWYLELAKVTLNGEQSDAAKCGTRFTLVTILDAICRLAHPIIPFITETIWQEVKQYSGSQGDTIMLAPYPQSEAAGDQHAVNTISWLQDVITKLRTIRAELNVSPKKEMSLIVQGALPEQQQYFEQLHGYLKALTKAMTIEFKEDDIPPSSSAVLENLTLHVPIAGLIDIEAEKVRLQTVIEKLEADIARMKGKLSQPNFVDKAPEAVVQKERDRLKQAENEAELLSKQLSAL